VLSLLLRLYRFLAFSFSLCVSEMILCVLFCRYIYKDDDDDDDDDDDEKMRTLFKERLFYVQKN